MGRFSADDQLLLSSLIYFDGVVDHGGSTVKEIVNNIKTNGVQRYIENGKLPGAMNTDEWNQVFESILKRPDLCLMRLANSVDGNNGYPDNFRAATFITDPSADPSDAIVIFRGTADSVEQWSDNVEGAFEFDTKHQQYAYQYTENVLDDLSYKTNVMVTGHSKGGNLAAYAATLDNSGKIDSCTTFDSQGFSDMFFKKYSELIETNHAKITAIVAQKDKVSLLLRSVAKREICYETINQDDPTMYHKFNLLIGRMTKNNQVERLKQDQQLKGLLDDLIEDARSWSPDLQNLVCDSIGKQMTKGNIGSGNIAVLVVALLGEIEAEALLHHDISGLMNTVPKAMLIVLLLKSAENYSSIDEILIDMGKKALILEKLCRGVGSCFYVEAMKIFNEWFRRITATNWLEKNSEYLAGQEIKIDTGRLQYLANRLARIQYRQKRLDDYFSTLKLCKGLDMNFFNIRFMEQFNEAAMIKVRSCSDFLHNAADIFESCENKIIASAERLNG